MTLDLPGTTFTQALGVNNSDDVVGLYNDAAGNAHGFMYEKGKYEPIDVMGSTSTVINNRDQIVGFFVDANTGYTVGVVGDPKR